MLNFTTGDMFEVPADIRVNTVNCVGVMGKGVALAFKQRYPLMFQRYVKDCQAGFVKPGVLHTWHSETEWIINFPTKRHWRDNSFYEDIDLGLFELRDYLNNLDFPPVVTLPALGCGHGGLDWEIVSEMIKTRLANVNAEVHVFSPMDSIKIR